VSGDLEALREDHPGWQISTAWVSRSDGPDVRILRAERGTVRLSARTPADLSRQIAVIEHEHDRR
jgi:hypothetical protein